VACRKVRREEDEYEPKDRRRHDPDVKQKFGGLGAVASIQMGSLLRLTICLALFFVAACSPSQARNVDVTEHDQGRTIDLVVGDTLTVRLSGNPSTGFNWKVASPPTSVLQQIGDRGAQQPTTTGIVGASETITFRSRAAAAGETKLSLAYRRSFETVPPARTFDFGLRVR
jgi:inhibitor of cysteine peptidase